MWTRPKMCFSRSHYDSEHFPLFGNARIESALSFSTFMFTLLWWCKMSHNFDHVVKCLNRVLQHAFWPDIPFRAPFELLDALCLLRVIVMQMQWYAVVLVMNIEHPWPIFFWWLRAICSRYGANLARCTRYTIFFKNPKMRVNLTNSRRATKNA